MANSNKTTATKNSASQKKKVAPKKPGNNAGRTSATGKKSVKNTNPAETPRKRVNKEPETAKKPHGFLYQLIPYITVVLAIFLGVCIFAGSGAGVVGGAIRTALLGLSGVVAYALPILLIIPAFVYDSENESGSFRYKILSMCVLYMFVSVLLHIFMGGAEGFSLSNHWSNGIALKGGGVIGGILGELMLKAFGKIGSSVLTIAVMIIPLLYIFGLTPRSLWLLIRYKRKLHKESAEERRLAKYEREREREAEMRRYLQSKKNDASQLEIDTTAAPQPTKYRIKNRKKFVADIPIDEDALVSEKEITDKVAVVEPTEEEIDEKIFDEAMKKTKLRLEKELKEIADSIPEEAYGFNSATLPADTTHDKEDFDGVDFDDELYADDDIPWDDDTATVTAEIVDSDSETNGGKLDLERIFVNPEDAELLDRLADAYLNGEISSVKSSAADSVETLTLSRETLGDGEAETPEVEKPQKEEYIYPPVTLITEDTEKRDENIKEELHTNAVKLVETLKSFNVKTKIENVSRGPTITRYELLPEAGIRVRSILNLVDDISLNLATTGIRIEAPIPDKPAVGIEVPNKKRAMVHLRTLLEDEKFQNANSKLLCALGEDVGGEGVYLDIAKMPHLLIAGATGMGKSVCINSLIVSLLYNASPEEVKLILIDPKKVELNIYNGIPHLLVPVVSDPKKAAGSLSWAVSEMERRFGLIESVGVRNVNMYNKVTADDPAYEFLPYIVIIIDELADLMMTAPDDVEESVCRLMQKARAAGMHIIIGTQRPSVDVITGLIKANIPSRIAFTVASQVDSRTIIDRSGAENLIGKGDMLYVPVGAAKPIRVQGAFISEEDVDKVVTFIKSANCDTEISYSNEVIEQIEKEAAKCGSSKKSSASSGTAAAEDVEDDPMMRPAIELAVTSGKISTSLIQRRLSLGYGRAAKLIDRMEQLGYVSPPEGQKPRNVLITKEQFMEMVLKNEDGAI